MVGKVVEMGRRKRKSEEEGKEVKVKKSATLSPSFPPSSHPSLLGTHGAADSSVASIVTSSPSILVLSEVVVVGVVGFSASSAVMSSSSSWMFARLLASLSSGSEERARLLLALGRVAVVVSLGLEDMVGVVVDWSQSRRERRAHEAREEGRWCLRRSDGSERGRCIDFVDDRL